LVLGSDIRDASGNRMSAGYTATATIAASMPTTLTAYSPDPPKTIGDLSRTTSTLTINQDVTISQLSVKLSVSHSNDSDTRITLQGPDGTKVLLFDRRGGSGQDISTVFDDRSRTPIGQDSAPFLGWHKPEQALSALAGKSARGTWTLIAEDLASGNTGKLNSWALIVEGTASSAGASAVRDAIPMLAVGWAESSRPTAQPEYGGPRSKTRSAHPTADDVRTPILGASLESLTKSIP
jgi:subtilisin-like proprotein convertase family protein